MALNFPNNPQTGDTYLAPNNQTYLYDGEKWIGFITPAGTIAQGITFVGDDSTGTRVSDGESFKIAGTQNVSTAVSGDTLTITGPNLSSYLTNSTLTVVGDDSTGVTLNSGETIKIAGSGSITTAVSGDTITITGTGGGASIGDLTVDGTTISTDITNANLILTGNGTGGVVIEDLEITGSTINALTTNNNLTLTTNGTGKVIINALSVNEINSNDSSAIQINDSINVSGQGTFNNTTKFNAGVTIGANVEPDGTYSRQLGTGDKRWVQIYTLNLDMVGSLTVDGTAGQAGQLLQSNGGSYVPAWTSNITVNSIASSDSSAIQINDAVNVSGLLTANAGLTINNNSNTWSFGSDGLLTVPANGIITAPNAQEFQLQAKAADSVLRNEINLDPNNGTYMSVWSEELSTSFSTGAGSWVTASWVNASGFGAAYFTGAEDLQNFWTTGPGSFVDSVEVSINGGARGRAGYEGNNGGGSGVELSVDRIPVSSPTAITSLVFYYRTKNRIDIDYLNGQLLLNTQSMNINLETNSYINLKSTRANPVRIITNNNTHMWEFDSTGSLTLPREGKIYGIGQGAASDRYGYISWDGNSSGDGSGYNTMRLVPDQQGLEDADQYIIIDPTAGSPGHIHIRAGGTQDNSGADLYLGGEHSNVKISAGANPPVTVMANDNSWTFGTDGDLTIPGDIKSTANTSIIVDGGVLIADVTVLSVDSFGAGVWRMFISSSAYPTLGTFVQVGDTATTAWNNSVAVTITSIVEDIGAGTWALHTDQNLFTGWYENVDARRITINSTQVKTWTFGTNGTTLFPNQAIDGGTAPIELKSRSWSQLTYNNTSMTPAPNKNHSTTFYVEGGDALLEIFRWDGNSVLQHREWTFSNDGSLTLPDTGTITFPDSTTQNTAARITIVGDDSTGVTLNAGETIKIAGAGSITTAVSGDTLTITGSKDINVNSITSSDSSAIQINDGVNVSGVLNAKTLITNTISSEDSTAIQVNDGLRISGDLTFSDNTVQTTAYVPADNLVKVSGTWTVTTGTNTYSFTVPTDGTYTMWVKGNIPNGIIIWNATVSVSNSNVAAIGTQYAWNYTGGGSPISLTGIPGQIRGSAGTISTDNTYAGGTSNRFDFGISNTSGSSQTIYYGYTKIS